MTSRVAVCLSSYVSKFRGVFYKRHRNVSTYTFTYVSGRAVLNLPSAYFSTNLIFIQLLMFQFQSQPIIVIVSSVQEFFRTPNQRQKQGFTFHCVLVYVCTYMLEQRELLTAGSLLSERKGTALQTVAVVGSLLLGNKLSVEKIKTIEERNA